MKYALKCLVCAALILIAGCAAPRKIYRMTPVRDYQTSWLYGHEIVHLDKDDLELKIAFIENIPDLMVFNLEVINHSDSTFLIDPVDFYCEYEPVLPEEKPFAGASDPEKVIRDLDKEIARKKARLKSQKRADLLFEAADLVADIAEDRTEEEELRDEELDQVRRQGNDVSELSRRNEIQNLYARKKTWTEKSLRKTTVSSGDSVTGRIYFPVRESALKMKIIIPLGESTFSILYDQSEI